MSATTLPPDTRSAARWICLLFAWAAFFMSFVDRLAWSNAAGSVSHALAIPLAALGSFVTAFYVGYVISNVAAGYAGDWLGPRVTMGGSLVLLGLATLLFGSVASIAAGLAVQFLMGLSAGADYAAGVKLISAWFTLRDRGRAMGLFMTATSLAVVLTNLAVPAMLPSLGWPGTYRLLGLLTLVLGVLAAIVVRDAPGDPVPHRRPDFALLFRNRDLLLLGLAGFGALWGTWGFAFWAGLLMRQGHGLTVVQSGTVVSLFGVGAIVAKPAIGWLSDWMGGRKQGLIIACLLFFVAMLLVFSQLQTFGAFALLAAFLGVGAFAYSPLMNAMVAEAAGRGLASSGAGVTNAFWGLGNVIVPSLLTATFAASHSFVLACVLLAIGPLLGAVCMAFVPDRFTAT